MSQVKFLAYIPSRIQRCLRPWNAMWTLETSGNQRSDIKSPAPARKTRRSAWPPFAANGLAPRRILRSPKPSTSRSDCPLLVRDLVPNLSLYPPISLRSRGHGGLWGIIIRRRVVRTKDLSAGRGRTACHSWSKVDEIRGVSCCFVRRTL
jgi:hypothetical protein